MKKYLLIGIGLVVALGWYYLYQLDKSVRRARSVHAKNSLLVTLQTLERTGQFTNKWPELHIYPFTNRFVFDGSNYECVIAIDSWDKKPGTVLAVTTNKAFVLIGEKEGPVPLIESRFPDWFW
jgi:hypothetical protein